MPELDDSDVQVAPPRAPVYAPAATFEQATRLPTTTVAPRTAAATVYPPANPAQLAPVQWTPAQPPAAPSGDIYQQVKDLPLAQAEEAVAAATRFQAQRGFQRDVQSGVPSAEAMAKWGPSLFFQPRQANLGQAAQFMRQAQLSQPWKFVPATTNEPAHYQSGGQKPMIVSPGSLPQVTGPVQAQPILDPETKQPIPGFVAVPAATGRGYTVHMTKPAAQLSPSAAAQMLSKLPDLESDFPGITKEMAPILRERIRGKVVAPPTAPKEAPTKQAKEGSMKRVWVKSKDGRTGTIPEDQLDSALAEGYTKLNR